MVHPLLFRAAAFAVCFQNMPGLYCSADIRFQTLTFAILETDLYPRKKKKNLSVCQGDFASAGQQFFKLEWLFG